MDTPQEDKQPDETDGQQQDSGAGENRPDNCKDLALPSHKRRRRMYFDLGNGCNVNSK